MTEPVTIAELIRARRAELELTDEEAAEALDVNNATFGRWRSGKSVPADDKAPDLAKWLQRPEREVVLAIYEGRRTRPTQEPVNFRDDVLLELRALRDEVAALRRELHQRDAT